MHVNIKDEKLIVTFKYDPKIVDVIRNLPGRLFNKKLKHWEFPKETVIEVMNALRPLGFTAHINVENQIKFQEKELFQINEIKNGNFNTDYFDKNYFPLFPLFPFQVIGAGFLLTSSSALLADVPGLGKTIQTLAALQKPGPHLIFCPNSLKFSWEAEILKWLADAEITVINGSKEVRQALWQEKTDWFIANYELLLADYNIIKNKNWATIVCDEATRISNPSAKSVKALKTLKAGKKIALTGTPISNSPIDIYSIIDWLAPGYLGSYFHFKETYCIAHPLFKSQIVGYKNLDDLSNRIQRFMLRRTKEEVFKDFPPKTIEDIVFELSEEEKKFYSGVKNQIAEEIEKLYVNTESLGLIMVKMLRLKQATDHPALISDIQKSSKLETLKELLEPIIKSGEKAIIFTQFAEMAKKLKDEFPGSLLIYGDVLSGDRQDIVNKFNKNSENKILIMTEAGAYGLNLQAASYVIHFDFPWSIAKLMQREDRAHRIGQNKPVTVYNLIAKKTIDEYVAKTLHRKQKQSVDILKDFERLESAGLEKEDIEEILRL